MSDLVEDPICECDNCAQRWKLSQLDPYRDIWSRLTPGGIVPHGDCPDCGAFCYAVSREVALEIALEGLLNCPALNEDFAEDETKAACEFARSALLQKGEES